MASFVGTIEEFRRYVGPRLRNLVQQITRKHKNEVGACEHCGSTKTLESAHVKGRDRNKIIAHILKNFTINNIIAVDISLFEDRFKSEHNPIEKSILILCKSCHRKYDAIETTENSETQATNEDTSRNNILPITLNPSNPVLFKQELLVYKKAEVETMYHDGTVKKKVWNASRFTNNSNVFGNLRSRPEYRAGNWQTSGIIKVHVSVIKNS